MRDALAVISALPALLVLASCGHKGPPLPPLIKTPAAPADFTAVRRGGDVDLQFIVPAANTDGTRPANVSRVDVYAYTGATTLADAQLLKTATKVGSVDVKAPRDPDMTTEPDTPDEEAEESEPLEGDGIDQGSAASMKEAITPAALTPIAGPPKKGDQRTEASHSSPMLLWPQQPPVRTYFAVPVGRHTHGPLSKRVGVPLLPPPAPPSRASISYTETEITVTWKPPAGAPGAQDTGDLLPSRPIGWSRPTIGFNVYDGDSRLTKAPVTEDKFVDTRITWGTERCYTVRSVEMLGDLAVESDAPPKTCRKLVDTFAPAAPKNLHSVSGEGSISLIWDPNDEKDLDGYLVLRGPSESQLEKLTPKPIADTTFKDTVPAGVTFVYAIQAVDKAGNVSATSNRVEDTAR